MPVGAAHRGVFKSSGGSSTTDSFNRADGAIGSTNGGDILAWNNLNGVWSITTNRPTTATAATSNPLTVVDTGSGDVDVQVDVSAGGGDALYFRVVDASNWIRMRVSNTTYSFTEAYTCAYADGYQCSFQQGYTCYAESYCQQYGSECAYGGASNCSDSKQNCYNSHSHGVFYCYSFSNSNGCCGSSTTHSHSASCYCSTGTFSHTHYHGGYTFNSGFAVCGSYNYTCYQTAYTTCYQTAYTTCYQTAYATTHGVIIEKNVAGTVTQIGTGGTAAPSTIRAVAVGGSITPYVNGSAQTVINDTTHQNATKHGIGKGTSPNLATAIDNFALVDKS